MYNEVIFRSIYRDYKDMVYNLALNYVQNQMDAQDISQEVFVKIYQNLHKHDPLLSSLKTWIYRITINQSLDFIKAKKNAKRYALFTGLFYTNTQEPISELLSFDHPGVTLENQEELKNLFKLINTLPDSQKTALILLKIEDRSQKEVAEIMNISEKAVESLLSRAKQTLSKKLNRWEGILKINRKMRHEHLDREVEQIVLPLIGKFSNVM